MGRKRKGSPESLQVLMRRQLAYRLRLQGYGYTQIGEKVRAWARREGLELPKGYDRRHAHQDLARYLAQRKRAYDAGVELEREIALQRCHELLRKVWPRAKRGHWRDVREARLLVERILELEGMRGKG